MKIVTRDYSSEIIGKIHTLLYLLGSNAGSSGFFQASYAVYLVVEQPERLQYITKYLYPAVAREYDTNWRAVERNIRHIANRAWHANPDLLRKMVKETGAHSTDLEAPESAEHLCAKCADYAAHWAPVAEEVWQKTHGENGDKNNE